MSSAGSSAATAFSATSAPTPVMSPKVMPIQPIINSGGKKRCARRFRVICRGSRSGEQADEGLCLEPVDPLLAEPLALLGLKGFFDLDAGLVQCSGVGRADLLDF